MSEIILDESLIAPSMLQELGDATQLLLQLAWKHWTVNPSDNDMDLFTSNHHGPLSTVAEIADDLNSILLDRTIFYAPSFLINAKGDYPLDELLRNPNGTFVLHIEQRFEDADTDKHRNHGKVEAMALIIANPQNPTQPIAIAIFESKGKKEGEGKEQTRHIGAPACVLWFGKDGELYFVVPPCVMDPETTSTIPQIVDINDIIARGIQRMEVEDTKGIHVVPRYKKAARLIHILPKWRERLDQERMQLHLFPYKRLISLRAISLHQLHMIVLD